MLLICLSRFIKTTFNIQQVENVIRESFPVRIKLFEQRLHIYVAIWLNYVEFARSSCTKSENILLATLLEAISSFSLHSIYYLLIIYCLNTHTHSCNNNEVVQYEGHIYHLFFDDHIKLLLMFTLCWEMFHLSVYINTSAYISYLIYKHNH